MLTYAFSGLEYGILKANGADINYLEVLSRNQTAKAYGFIDGVADFSIGALEASIKKAGANYKNLYNYIKSNIDGSCQDNIDTRFRTIKLMSQQALTGLPVYDFYEIDKYIHSKEFRNKVVLEALGTEIEIISVGGIGNYVKQKYLQYLDSLEVTDVYYGFGYTAGVLVDIIIGDYLESELVGAVFKDTFNTAQAAPKAEKAVAESGEEVLDQAEKAIESGTSSELKVIGTYDNNNYFTRAVEFNAGSEGTGFTYKVYQRNDIDWNIVRTTGAKKGRGLTNAQAAEKYGLAPILNDGYVATLHHSQQRSVGPLFEASTRYHNISNAKKGPLHPYKGQLNPFNPMDSNTRGLFQKVDSIEYWKARGRDAMKGVQ